MRRRLALQVDQYMAGPSPRILTRPSRSNLGFRLQTAMNLQVNKSFYFINSKAQKRLNMSLMVKKCFIIQVCYMNDLTDDENEDDDDEVGLDSSDDELPKSKSAPNLCYTTTIQDGSNMNATQLRQKSAMEGWDFIMLDSDIFFFFSTNILGLLIFTKFLDNLKTYMKNFITL